MKRYQEVQLYLRTVDLGASDWLLVRHVRKALAACCRLQSTTLHAGVGVLIVRMVHGAWSPCAHRVGDRAA